MRAKSIPKEQQFQLVLECRKSGLTDRQWCLENNINPGTFYNWVKRFHQEGTYDIPESEFHMNGGSSTPAVQDVVRVNVLPDFTREVEVKEPYQNAPLEISYGAVTMRISNSADSCLVSSIIKSLGGSQW